MPTAPELELKACLHDMQVILLSLRPVFARFMAVDPDAFDEGDRARVAEIRMLAQSLDVMCEEICPLPLS